MDKRVDPFIGKFGKVLHLSWCILIVFISKIISLQCSWETHLQNLRVVIHLPLIATFSCRRSPLGEVAALVQEEKGFSIFFF